MFIVLLKFSKNRDQAGEFKEGHMKWLKQGFDADPFVVEKIVTAEVLEIEPARVDQR